MDSIKSKKEYFASANGYNGFKSYFKEIFDSKKYTKIYVLKGGPGTGKSTFMKKIAAFAEEKNLDYEVFRCSSDPNSLDGITVKNNEASVLILDGTAPHERDACIPGAIDELINLGEAWDSEELEKERTTILNLNDQKKKCYRKAYEYLSYSSILNKNIKAEIRECFDFKKATEKCESIIDSIQGLCTGSEEIKLISSFSKNGYRQLNTMKEICNTTFSICGNFGTDKIMLTMISDILRNKSVKFTKLLSPLDESITEGIYFEYLNIAIICGNSENIICDSCEFLSPNDYISLERKINLLEGSKKLYLSLAQEELMKASDYHFSLEKIYTTAMNFEIINQIYSRVYSKIKNILLEENK